MKKQGVAEVFFCGLAMDYCVKFSALDAVQFGFKSNVIEDASRGVNLQPGDAKKAIAEMKRAGVTVLQSDDVMESSTVKS